MAEGRVDLPLCRGRERAVAESAREEVVGHRGR